MAGKNDFPAAGRPSGAGDGSEEGRYGDPGTHVDTGALYENYDELPPDLPLAPLPGPSSKATLGIAGATNTKFAVSTIDDDEFALPYAPRRHEPVPVRQRPTLLPEGFEQPPKLPGAPRTADPGLVRPVRPAADSGKPNVGNQDIRESSDVIQVYDTGGAGEMKRATMHSMAPPRTVPPGGGLQAVAPPAQRAPLRKVPSAQPAARPQPAPSPASYQAAPPAYPQAMPAPAHSQLPLNLPLPLHTDQMVDLIASHRSRLATLDSYARALEIAAGVLGTTSAGFLIASLVGLLVGSGHTLLGAATALVAETVGLALTIGLLAQATALRHQASAASQLAALLEALSQQRR